MNAADGSAVAPDACAVQGILRNMEFHFCCHVLPKNKFRWLASLDSGRNNMRCVQFDRAPSEGMPGYTASRHSSNMIVPSTINKIGHFPVVLGRPPRKWTPATSKHVMRRGDCMTMPVERDGSTVALLECSPRTATTHRLKWVLQVTIS